MSYPDSELYFPQHFLEELGLPSFVQFSLTPPSDLGPLNETDINVTEDIYATHVLGGAVSSSDLNPSCSLSMDSGQLYFPGVESHGPGHKSPSLYQSDAQATQCDQGPYSIPLDLDTTEPTTQSYDASQLEDLNRSTYHTDWGLQTHLHANSQNTSPICHINTETLNCNVSQFHVRRTFEELGFLPTSGHKSAQSSGPNLYPPQYNSEFEPVTYISQSSEATIPQYPHPETAITTNIPPAPFSSNNPYAPSFPSFHLSTQSYPVFQHDSAPDVQLQIPHFYNSPLSTTVISPITSPDSLVSSSPVTPLDGIPLPTVSVSNPAPRLAHHTLKRTHPSPSPPNRKRARASKKPALTPATSQKQIGKRKSPNGRAQIRSRNWIDKFFPNRRPCILCEKEGKKYKFPYPRMAKRGKWRNDRALEHLVSSHVLQIVKNVETFDGKALEKAPEHLLTTKTQFAYARKEVNEIKCSLCSTETSLVFRDVNIRDHLETVHAELPETAHKEELDRLHALMPDKKEWYSYHDKFLYHFPGGCPE